MDELDNIVDSQSADETKVLPTDQSQEEVQKLEYKPTNDLKANTSTTSTPDSDQESIEEDPYAKFTYDETRKPDVQYDERFNIDVDDYKDILGSSIYITSSGIDGLNKSRAINQSTWDQAGNFLAQTVLGEIGGGTIEGLGYLLDVGSIIDVMRGVETEWGNAMTDLGQGIRKDVQDNFAIHQDESLNGIWEKMGDSGWWFGNGVSVASTFSMMIPVAGATRALSMVGKGISMSKGLRRIKAINKMINKAEGMGARAKWTASGVNQAIMSRNIENFMEAHGTFEDVLNTRLTQVNPETGKFFTEEEATKSASQAAAQNYKYGWTMLLQDIPQYLGLGRVFNPISKKMENAVGVAKKKGVTNKMQSLADSKAGALAIGFVSEGTEEALQYYISGSAKLRSDLDAGIISEEEYNKKTADLIGDEEMMTGALFGGLGGNVFSLAQGGINKAFKNKNLDAFQEARNAMFEERLKHRMTHLNKLSQLQSVAEERGYQSAREDAVQSSMIEMVADALENDKFEQMYETLTGMQDMSQEEIDSLEKEAGIEYSSELAKQTTPKLVKMAEKMRKDYLSLRNKHSSKVSSNIIKLKARNEIALNNQKKAEQELSDVRQELIAESTPEIRNMWDIDERREVLLKRKEQLESEKNDTTSEIKKKYINEALKENKRLTKKLNKEQAEADNAWKEKGKLNEAQENYNALANALHDANYDEIFKKQLAIQSAKDLRIMNTAEMNDSLSDKGSERINNVEVENTVKGAERNIDGKTSEEAESYINSMKETIQNNENLSEAEKKLYEKKLNDALIDYKSKQEAIESDEAIAAVRKAAELENQRKNAEDNGVNNTNVTPIGEVTEDENSNEDPLTTDQQLDKVDNEFDNHVNENGLMPLLDKVTSSKDYEAFKAWSENPVSKVGEVFDFKLGFNLDDKMTDAEREAIKAFNSKEIDYKSIPQHVFDNLPVKAALRGREDEIYSFITTKPGPNAPADEHKRYSNTVEQRVNIIKRMKAGVEASSPVKKSSGGDLILAEFNEETGKYPRNNIMDLKYISGNMERVEILVSDKFGYLMNDRKERDPDLLDQITVGDDDGNPMPYRGGVFLKIKKANGEPFALRLNLANNTQEQSDLLSDIIIAMSVPDPKLVDGKTVPNKVGGTAVEKRELTLSSTVSDMNPELQAKVRELMGEEIKALDSEFKDPLVTDLITMFAHMGDGTQGKTTALYFENNTLYFGDKKIGINDKNNTELRSELSSFIRDIKRRPFNIKLWNSDNKYVEFALNNGLLTTNVITKDKDDNPVNAFQNTRGRNKETGKMEGRRIQMYMYPVMPVEGSSKPEKRNDGTTEIPMNVAPTEYGIPIPKMDNIHLINMLKSAKDNDLKKAKSQEEMDVINEEFDKEINALKDDIEDVLSDVPVESKPTQQTSGVDIDLSKIEDYDSESFITEVNRVFNVMFKKLPKNKLGGFYPGTNEIVMSEDLSGEDIVTTLSHEVIHDIIDKMDEKTKDKLHKDLKTLFSEIKSNELKSKLDKIGKGLYREMLTKPEEFLTHGLTDPRVLDILNSIKYENKGVTSESLIDKILKIISDIVIKDNTVAKELKNVFEKYIESQPTQQNSDNKTRIPKDNSVSLQETTNEEVLDKNWTDYLGEKTESNTSTGKKPTNIFEDSSNDMNNSNNKDIKNVNEGKPGKVDNEC